jgi:hypothetical protein
VEKNLFLYSSLHKKVSGPFRIDEVNKKIENGEVTGTCNIWWRGQREWLSVDAWVSQDKNTQTEKGKLDSPVWYVDINGQSKGPLTQSEMLLTIQGVQNFAKLRLWTVGEKNWKSVYEYTDVMEELGMSRRENLRAPLMGSVLVNRTGENDLPLSLKAVSISIAGIGCNDAHALTKGEELQLIIKSNEFSTPIRARATTIYVGSNGNAGLKFSHLQPETQSIIIDYVKKFADPHQLTRKSAA